MSERPFSQVGVPLVVAHRGASLEHPENTLVAFEAAVEAGAGAVEFDVRVTADGHAVVMHDATVDRTTDGTGLVHGLTLQDVRRLRIGGAERVPTLGEALTALSGRVAVDIEIKNVPGEPDFEPDRETAVALVHAALDEVSFVGEVIVSSFNPMSIAASRRARPEIATGLLTNVDVEAEAAIRFAAEQGHVWVLPYVGQLRDGPQEASAAAHHAGLFLGTWITDDPKLAADLFAGGVDAVATNDPRRLVSACRELLRR
jgi:glycerophosphoryl diester phosphodiesterase